MHNPGEWIKQISEYHDIQGKLLVAVPDIESWQSKLFGKHWAALYAPQHLYFYNRKSLIELFRKSGYTSIKQIMFDRRSDPFLFVTSLFRNLDPNIIMNDETANKITVHRKAMFLILYFIFYLPVKIVNLLTGRPALLILLLSKEKKTDVCR
jgi:hypothetical protein